MHWIFYYCISYINWPKFCKWKRTQNRWYRFGRSDMPFGWRMDGYRTPNASNKRRNRWSDAEQNECHKSHHQIGQYCSMFNAAIECILANGQWTIGHWTIVNKCIYIDIECHAPTTVWRVLIEEKWCVITDYMAIYWFSSKCVRLNAGRWALGRYTWLRCDANNKLIELFHYY